MARSYSIRPEVFLPLIRLMPLEICPIALCSLSTEERKKCHAPWHPGILSHCAGIENRTADTFLWFSVVEDIASVEAAPIGAAVVVVQIGILPFESGGPV